MSHQWFYTQDGKTKIGPVSEAHLKELARTSQLQPSEMVRREDAGKWTPASNVQRLFHDAKPINTADCPKCEAVVPVKPPHRSTQQLWQEFVPWYKEKFKGVMELGGVKSILAQAALWYLGSGVVWIPMWFRWSTKPLYNTAPAKCPKCSQEFDALSEGKNPRFVPFDWGNLAATVAKVAVGLSLVFVAVVATIVIVVGAIALIFGAAAAATNPSSDGSGTPEPRPSPGPKPSFNDAPGIEELACASCSGKGWQNIGTPNERRCPSCGGQGVLRKGHSKEYWVCSSCSGKGWQNIGTPQERRCPSCGGQGLEHKAW